MVDAYAWIRSSIVQRCSSLKYLIQSSIFSQSVILVLREAFRPFDRFRVSLMLRVLFGLVVLWESDWALLQPNKALFSSDGIVDMRSLDRIHAVLWKYLRVSWS